MPNRIDDFYRPFALPRIENVMIFGREPAIIIALIGAIMALAISFGLDLSDNQQAAINGLAFALVAVWVRSNVSPVAHEKKTTLPR